MATQSITTFEQIGNAAPAPSLRRPLLARRSLLPVRAQTPVPHGPKPAGQNHRALVEMLPMVKRMAFKIREHLPTHVDVDDLMGNGVLGLVDAVAKFDSAKRVKLESYARHRVRGGILDGLRRTDPASRDLRRLSKKVRKVYREMETKLARPIKDDEIAAALGMNLAKWHRTLNEIQNVGFDSGARILSAGPTTRRPSAEPAHLADDGANPFDLCYRREQREILGRALSHLRERERKIIVLYYEQELTMKQIADRLNVDESRISQLHSAALVRLKAGVSSLLRPRLAAGPVAPALAKAAGAAS